MNYRFKLEPYKGKKHECPDCGELEFVYYVDTLNNNMPIHPSVGRCERINNCTYHLTPYAFFSANGIEYDREVSGINLLLAQKEAEIKQTNYINYKLVERSMKKPVCNFTAFLLDYLRGDMDIFMKLVQMYRIGADQGNVVFWQIDGKMNVRTGKIMSYNGDGHRSDYLNWVHSLLIKAGKIKEFNLKQCLFGEHLLTEYPDSKQVLIVESEKTAILLKTFALTGIPKSGYKINPDIIVMATGGSQDLSIDRMKPFEGLRKEIFIIPDIGAEKIWEKQRNKIVDKLNLDLTLVDSQKFIGHTWYDIHKLDEGQDVADYLVYRRFK